MQSACCYAVQCYAHFKLYSWNLLVRKSPVGVSNRFVPSLQNVLHKTLGDVEML